MTKININKIKHMQDITAHTHTLTDIYRKLHDYDKTEAMDGDSVDEMMRVVKEIANDYQGNK